MDLAMTRFLSDRCFSDKERSLKSSVCHSLCPWCWTGSALLSPSCCCPWCWMCLFFFPPPIWPEYILYKKSSPVIQMLAAWNSYATVLPPFLHVWLMDRVSSKDNTNCILCLFCISSAVILQALFSVSIVWFLWCVIYPTVCVTVSLVSLPCWQWCLFFSLHSCCCGY